MIYIQTDQFKSQYLVVTSPESIFSPLDNNKCELKYFTPTIMFDPEKLQRFSSIYSQ